MSYVDEEYVREVELRREAQARAQELGDKVTRTARELRETIRDLREMSVAFEAAVDSIERSRRKMVAAIALAKAWARELDIPEDGVDTMLANIMRDLEKWLSELEPVA